MEVLPRLKTAPQSGSSLYNNAAPNGTLVKAFEHKEKNTKYENTEKNEDSKRNDDDIEDNKPEKNFFQQHLTLIIIFALVIIVLIVIIIWLVNNKMIYSPKKNNFRQLDQLPPKTVTISHSDVVNNVPDDELSKFAELDNSSSFKQPVYVPETTPSSSFTQPVYVTEPIPSSTFTQPVYVTEPTTSPYHNITLNSSNNKNNITSQVLSIGDSDIEHKLNAKLDAMSQDINETSPMQAITETVDNEIIKMEAEQNKPIEQLNLKTKVVIAVFNTKEELYKANFDPEQVLTVCRGDSKSHKKFSWRFKTTIDEPS